MDATERMPPDQRELTALDKWLESLDARELRTVVRDLVARDESAERMLAIRAMPVGASGPEALKTASAKLGETVNTRLRTRGFVDYRRSFRWARDAEEMLDQLEQHLDSGAADVTQPASNEPLPDCAQSRNTPTTLVALSDRLTSGQSISMLVPAGMET